MATKYKMPRGKEFVFKPAKFGADTRYEWDTWFNGELWLLEQSEGVKDEDGTVVEVTHKKDYEIRTNWMPAKIKLAARKRYKVVQLSRLDADGNKLGDAIILKARDMDEQERAEEDRLRVEEKAEFKRKKAEKKAARVAGNGASDTGSEEAE